MSELIRDRQLRRIPGVNLTFNADLTNATWMKTRARADVFASIQDPAGLLHMLRLSRREGYPLLLLGEGSNMIFATSHFEGIVARFDSPAFKSMEVVEPNVIRVGAGAKLGGLMNFSRTSGLMGLEFCTMIPGTVGGALAGNAGTSGWGLCDFVDRALVMSREGEVIEFQRNDFRYSYRHSELSQFVILEAEVRLEKLDKEIALRNSREFREKKKNQPYKTPNAGCIFKNPYSPQHGKHVGAGMLIDQAGLKNYCLNSAAVSEGHANFIVNRGTAAGEDFLAMVNLIQDIIFERFGLELELEVKVVGGPLTSCEL